MNRTVFRAAGALALAALLWTGWGQVPAAWAQTENMRLPVPVGKTAKGQGGNKVLMDEWVKKKQMLRDEVYQELKRHGSLPANGQVTVEATVVPDPKRPGKTYVRIDSLSIVERPSKPQPSGLDPAFAPRQPGGQTEFQNGSLPVGGRKMSETITFIGGKPQ